MNTKIIVCGLLLITNFCVWTQEENYEFYGRHFIASYKECDADALQDVAALMNALTHAVQSSGATILQYECEKFPGNGMTAFFVLSESHASIHTYPEHNACFVDLFTCGHKCSHEKFDAILRAYLKPKNVNNQLCIRT